ncbi:unnamed protein product [Phytomonas sp. EM1]|nr:unnamed protein product [Phytomonas sp. EM1]|eukprot:CCW65338.1 unnamed protein product [Phytomonas sp. isolate EM1]
MAYHTKTDISTMDSSIQQWKLHPTLFSAVQDLCLEPTALLTTVLTRTTTDFADVLVDGRCATGSSTVGTATAIWLHNSGALNTPGGHNLPLYKTPAATHERQVLTTLYAVHALLTNLTSRARNQRGGIGGGGGLKGVEVSILLAASDTSLGPMHDLAKKVGGRCKVGVFLVRHGESFSEAIEKAVKASSEGKASEEGVVSAPAGSSDDSAAAGFLLVTTLKSFLGWNGSDFARGLAARQYGESAGVAVEGEHPKEAIPKCFVGVVPHIAALVAEDIGVLHPGTADEASWHDIIGGILVASERAHARSITITHLFPHFMWLCLGPLSSLSPLVRSRLSRRNRRHYPLLPNNYISSSSASLAHCGPGTTSPMESIHMRYLLYLDDKDREEQLQMILKQTYVFHRALLLTHHKDIRQLSAKIQASGLYDSTNSNPCLTTSMDSHADNSTTSPSGGNQVNASDSRQYFLLRSDAPERQHNLLLSFTQSKSQESTLLIGWDTCTAVDLMDIDVLIQYYPPQKSLTEQEWAEFIQILHTTGDGELKIESMLRSNPNNSEQHIKLKVAQLRVGLSTSSPLISSRCRQSPVIVTFIGNSDFSLCAHFIQQYYYSGGTGTLLSAAASSALSAVTTTPGQPGVWLPSADPAHLPILNICASHPLFPLLVTGLEEGLGSVLRSPRPPIADMEDPITIRNVLKVKLQKEREMLSRAGPRGGSTAGGSNGSPFTGGGNARSGGSHAIGAYNIMNSVMSNNNSPAAASLGVSGNSKSNPSLQLQGPSGGQLTDASNGNGSGGQSSRKGRRGNRNNRRRGLSARKMSGNGVDVDDDKSTSMRPVISLSNVHQVSAVHRQELTSEPSRDKSGSSNENGGGGLNNKDTNDIQRQLKGLSGTRRGGRRKSRADGLDDTPHDKQLNENHCESGPKKDEDAQRIRGNVSQPKTSIAEMFASAVAAEGAGDTTNKQSGNSNLDAANKKKSTAHVVGGMLEKIGVKARVESGAGI